MKNISHCVMYIVKVLKNCTGKHILGNSPKMYLLDNWDLLNQSWNQIKVLACILPYNLAHTLTINVKIILQPERHWRSVQDEKKDTRTSVLQKQLTYMSPLKVFVSTGSSQEASSSNAIAQFSNTEFSDTVEIVKQITTSKKLASNLKHTLTSRKIYQQPKIGKLIDPSINYIGYAQLSWVH